VRRTLALWLLLFGVYAATLGLDAFSGSDYAGDEPHYLLAAHSIVDDGDVDVRDEYRERAYSEFYPHQLRPHGRPIDGRLNEPHGVGFPLLIAPAYAIGGARGVEVFLAAIAALAVALAYRLGVRVAPDPWALGAALAVGLSPPFVAYGTAVYPELAAAAALAGATLLAVRLWARVTWPEAALCFLLLGAVPWLGTKFVPAGVVIGAFAARSIWVARRRTLAVGAVEVTLFSVAL
jgi:4-amino-4-deoxy-L-arabinose transferase-like glycosyltransferase